MKYITLSLAFLIAVAAAGCGSDAKCTANCSDASASDTSADQATDQTTAPDTADAPDSPDVQADLPDVDAGSTDTTDAGCEADAGFECAAQGIGHFCSDTVVSAVCVAEHWQCPGLGVPSSQCRCTGPVGNGCTYTPDCVLICPDGGPDGPHDSGSDESTDN